MSYVREDNQYLLTNISALHINGYLKTHDEFRVTIMLNGEYELTEENTFAIENEIKDLLPFMWYNKVMFEKVDKEKVKYLSSVVIIFKK